MGCLLVTCGVEVGLLRDAALAQDRVVDRVVFVFRTADFDFAGEGVGMVGQRRAHGLVVDEVGASLLDVQAAGESVVRVEEPGVEAGEDLLSFGTLAGAVLREGFADVLAVVAVVVTVGVGHDVVGHRGRDLHGVVRQVEFQHVHLARQVGEFVVGVFYARVKLDALFEFPVVVGRQRPVHGVLLGVVVRLLVADGRGVHGRGGRRRSVLVGRSRFRCSL